MNQEQLESVMGLIIYSGNAKSDAMEAISAAKKGDFDEAATKIKTAENAIVEAHHTQTSMLTNEAKGNAAEITLLTIHSQDHLMTAIAFCDLAKEIIDLHRLITANAISA
ncbi:PTS lactose/cellobiose transporter subunit IIA [Enterococcus gallinarum]|uniref:PTS lactose/cellobiose transporter subunit IIA n=1 Tax=Enterococcus gallinarum TaxID=1353 RepID=A0ABD4ZRI5_ENTGA|nr:PTS lactose/cellobiose transporter subunit IIA [Enterococcus gallinarum]MBF0822392.1 PTS lactose/cellobiose transporter subunit IIA [Enterococcus faecalis]MBF0724805.1 PTS lactose/cellobiose transporter subunit IIA [Enterococcus gallinarum]MBF0796606.1 PTS lactose/cellobiose transporter subunit IIA [Enterococcus gallinarum]MBX8977481.1 PTS lactose/cellobiose transporter subunit IIA [Enterococcus gallinarum]MDL4874748.1 PTS lactose/cellobiose transporter subunit IIA [Enterococcus gallinarum]